MFLFEYANLLKLFQISQLNLIFLHLQLFFIIFLCTFASDMKIIIDDKIPYIADALRNTGADTIFMRGADISAADVRDADALIVRTRTRCDRSLLEGSKVQFIATATIGYDHLDTSYLESAGIAWTNCPGCNASSVAQYVRSVLLLLSADYGLNLSGATLGVVGCGHVGSLVKQVGVELGMRVLVCDPLVAEPDFVSMSEITQQADVITFHVPLTHEGNYATWHMANETFFASLARRPFIINSSRGGVVDEQALHKALDSGVIRQAVIDTWENEPRIDLTLLNKVYIGTPHIAGYSADGKANATNMSVSALCRHFGIAEPSPVAPPALPSDFVYTGNPLELYNPLEDSLRLKQNPSAFEQLRGDYPLRRESVFAQTHTICAK